MGEELEKLPDVPDRVGVLQAIWNLFARLQDAGDINCAAMVVSFGGGDASAMTYMTVGNSWEAAGLLARELQVLDSQMQATQTVQALEAMQARAMRAAMQSPIGNLPFGPKGGLIH